MFGKRSMRNRAGLWVMSSRTKSAPLHLAVDGAGHHIPGRQRFERMIPVHELVSRDRFQYPAFAAHRLADQKGLGLGMVEAGGMKLDEFHVGHPCPGTIGHGHAVAGGNVRIGCIEIDLAAAARGQEDDRRGERFHPPAAFFEHVNALAPIDPLFSQFLGGDQIDGKVILKDLDIGLSRDCAEQGPLDFAPGHIFGVENAAFGMAALLAEIKLLHPVGARHLPLREAHTKLDELGNPRRPLFNDRADHLFLTQASPGFQSVAHVHLEGILLAGHGGDPALGIVGVGFGAVLLRNDCHPAARRHIQSKGEPGNAAAENQEIEMTRAAHGRILAKNRLMSRNAVGRVTLKTAL